MSPADISQRSLGTFSAWTATSSAGEEGETLCYAFTADSSSQKDRGPLVLSVSKMSGSFVSVALSLGFSIPEDANVTVSVGPISLAFSPTGTNAFARDTDAAVQAFKRGQTAIAHVSGPDHQMAIDRFSLMGFSAAYAAITGACQD